MYLLICIMLTQTSALTVDWKAHHANRLCAAQADGIRRRYNGNPKSVYLICTELLNASEHTYDDYDYEECFEWLNYCTPKSDRK